MLMEGMGGAMWDDEEQLAGFFCYTDDTGSVRFGRHDDTNVSNVGC